MISLCYPLDQPAIVFVAGTVLARLACFENALQIVED
jgi:hypothetical protein